MRYDVECDFTEYGNNLKGIPQLGYVFTADGAKKFIYDVPFGVIERPQQNIDVCTNSFACAIAEDKGIMLTTDSKYGFRADGGALSVDLIRGSFNPDPFPEVYRHKFSIGVGITSKNAESSALIKQAATFGAQPEIITFSPKSGVLPKTAQFFNVCSKAIVSTIKPAEDGEGVIIRLYEANGLDTEYEISVHNNIHEAYICDALEVPTKKISVTSEKIKGKVLAFSSITLKILT